MPKRDLSGDDRLRDSFPRSVHSVRTRYSFVTALFLLVGLVLCFVVGRFVLLNLLHDTEVQVDHISTDIASTTTRHAEFVRVQLSDFQGLLRSRIEEGRLPLRDLVGSRASEMAKCDFEPSLALTLSADGRLLEGCCTHGNGETIREADLAPYRGILSGWCRQMSSDSAFRPVGILRVHGVFHYVTLMRLGNGRFLISGRRFSRDRFMADVLRLFPGMDIRSVHDVQVSDQGDAIASDGSPAHALRASVGVVELGGTPGEAKFVFRDMVGATIVAISVSVSKTFTNVTLSAISRMATLFAIAGILLAIPIFWLQGRILLNPLTQMARAVTGLADRHTDIDCPRLEWKGRDEFATLAEAVNRMLATISARAISVANLERRHQALINGLPDALAIFDGQGRLVSVTKEAEGVEPLPGFSRGEPPDGAVFGFAEVDRFVTVVADTMQSGNVGQVRLKVQRPKGVPRDFPTRHFELRVTRMDEHFVLAIVRDVSKEVAEHKLRLAAERRILDSRKRESLTSLAAGIAHDMNNVLSIVLNAAEASDADPSGDSVKSLGTIRDAVRRGTSMMRELQTFAGDNRIDLHRASPKLVLDDVMQLASRVIGDNVVLSSEVEPDVPDIDVDPNQFWKVLFNILKNSNEAIGDAPGHIRVKIVPFQMSEYEASNFVSEHPLPPGPGVLFCVEDDGAGIPREILDRLFDPYVSSKALGRGLGLATVRTIVEAHSGGIRVKSAPNRGTTFLVFLPAAKSSKTLRMKRPDLAAPAVPSAVGGGDVLMVDNDEAILKTTSILLKVLKLGVHVAHDRREALAVVRRHAKRLKVILLDAHLGGIDTVRLLGAFRIGAPGVPVIVSSGSAEDEMRELFRPHPYDAFLAKPYTVDELRRVIGDAEGK